MGKILHTGKQFVLTIPAGLVKRMGWKKGTEVIVSKLLEKDILFIEEIKKRKK